ncbi:Survival motor neuron domain-containing protein 1 [Intoshia linei]|uniref:Survival motor neuron domain-containing protein 1 n=1 Tax=Intoshia linei TaxID=1819745 RepID=A0A177BCJ7_9BILA|nr:Survival motor neuron domain-containing protein 1 [Intoshia linei]
MNSSKDTIMASIVEYDAQLVQTQVALQSDKNNSVLIKLRDDLKLGIKMYKDILADVESEEQTDENTSKFKWTVGDSCMALWEGNNKYHAAKITEIGINETCTIMFDYYESTQQHDLSTLKPQRSQTKIKKKSKVYNAILKKKKRKEEYLTKVKEFNEVQENEKYNWSNFLNKKNRLNQERSIFHSPSTLNGKVGVGTCDTGGKNMTKGLLKPEILKRGVAPKRL